MASGRQQHREERRPHMDATFGANEVEAVLELLHLTDRDRR
jgi:hypothetical protein